MTIPLPRITVRGLMGLVALAIIAMAMTVGDETVSYSCHLCHNRKHVVSRLLLGLRFNPREAQTTRFPTRSGHRHDWYQYSRDWSTVAGGGAACSSLMYQDGSDAPDGNP